MGIVKNKLYAVIIINTKKFIFDDNFKMNIIKIKNITLINIV